MQGGNTNTVKPLNPTTLGIWLDQRSGRKIEVLSNIWVGLGPNIMAGLDSALNLQKLRVERFTAVFMRCLLSRLRAWRCEA